MVFWLKPRVIEMSDTQGILMMRFKRRTKNHVNSMYFGVLAVGAELAAGVLALNIINKQKNKIVFVFKDFQGEFLKRCEGDTYFICDEGLQISETISKLKETHIRQNVTLNVSAIVPSQFANEAVCKFKLTLSINLKK
jgi:hypothetical protein